VDCGVLFAGPLLATLLADFGADVLKVEHPRGDPLRSLGWNKNGSSLWWAFVNRNKRCATLNLSDARGAKLLEELIVDADVLVESFRPGTLERWGLGYERLAELNPGLVLVQISGFGQTGPYRDRPGFGTVAEAMSGYAHITGFPDGPPTLPPFALADGIAALYGAVATLAAVRHKQATGRGQKIDVSLFEPLFSFLGPQALAYDQLAAVQNRMGNATDWTAPRNAYQVKDGRWVAISSSSQSIAERVLRLVGRPELIDEPWFADHAGRIEHAEELDAIIGGWIAERSLEEVLDAFTEAQAAIGPVYSIADIFRDAQYAARETITTVDDPVLGAVRAPNVVPRMSETPGRFRHLGAGLGADNEQVFVNGLGHSTDELAEWKREGVV
jgi:formyl-CoA transferase